MSRACTTCQHLKRSEIDRRLAAGEPVSQIARDYEIKLSSLHRHKTNCLKLSSSNAIMKDVARGTAAVALLPSKETLSGAYFELRDRIDRIVGQAQAEGSLAVAVSGLNSLRQTLDSLARLAGHIGSAQVNVAVQTNVNIGVTQVGELLIGEFDNEPELKARIARALLQIDTQQQAVLQINTHQTTQAAAPRGKQQQSSDGGQSLSGGDRPNSDGGQLLSGGDQSNSDGGLS